MSVLLVDNKHRRLGVWESQVKLSSGPHIR